MKCLSAETAPSVAFGEPEVVITPAVITPALKPQLALVQVEIEPQPVERAVNNALQAQGLSGHAPSVYLASLSPGSRRTMRHELEKIASLVSSGTNDFHSLPWHQLRFQHTQAIRAALSERDSPATVNKAVAALKGTLKAAWRLSQINTDDYQRAVDIAPVSGNSEPAGRMLNEDEIGALLAACDGSGLAGVRDAAMIAVGIGAGLRRASLVAWEMRDYEAKTGRVRVRKGKGNKTYTTFLGDDGQALLRAWLEVRGDAPGPVFLPLRRGRPRKDGTRPNAQPELRPLTSQAFMDVLMLRVKQAKLEHVSPHDLRRTFISTLLEEGVDLATAQKLAGHSDIKTTAGYDRRGEKQKQRASNKIKLKRLEQGRLDL